MWKKVFLYGNTARQYRGGVIHTYYIKIYFMQEGDKSKWKQKNSSAGSFSYNDHEFMRRCPCGGHTGAGGGGSCFCRRHCRRNGRWGDHYYSIRDQSLCQNKQSCNTDSKKAAKNGKVTIRKRTPKGKYKITVTAAGKGIYGKKSKVITITIK